LLLLYIDDLKFKPCLPLVLSSSSLGSEKKRKFEPPKRQEAELGEVDKKLLWGRQFLNPYSLEQ
jgi:hypothetical protein